MMVDSHLRRTSIEMNDGLNIVSHMNPTGSPFIILTLFNNNCYILLVNSDGIYLTSIDRINNSDMSYCIINRDRTIIINQLDGVRRGYLNCNSNNLLTYDREAGCIFSIIQRELVEFSIDNETKITGISYLINTSNNDPLMIRINNQLRDMTDMSILTIPINVRIPTEVIIPIEASPSLPVVIDSIDTEYDQFYHYNRTIITRRLIIIAIIIVIFSLYVLVSRGLSKLKNIT